MPEDLRLRDIDANLLVALDVLLSTASVREAAQALGVTPSAMSHTLNRLRGVFDDPLLVRARGRMQPTERAHALRLPLRTALGALERALHEAPEFDPRTSRRTFTLAAMDIVDALLLPRWMEFVGSEAPGCTINVRTVSGSSDRELERGDIDAAIVARLDLPDAKERELIAMGEGRMRRTLLRDRFVTFVRAAHPDAALLCAARRSAKKLDAYARAKHVLVAPSGAGEGIVDAPLRNAGRARTIQLRVPNFQTALRVVASTDLVLTAPAALVHCAPRDVFRTGPAPVALPTHTVALVWHGRVSGDPAHAWFRESLRNCMVRAVA